MVKNKALNKIIKIHKGDFNSDRFSDCSHLEQRDYAVERVLLDLEGDLVKVKNKGEEK